MSEVGSTSSAPIDPLDLSGDATAGADGPGGPNTGTQPSGPSRPVPDVPPACVFCRIVDGHEQPAGPTRSVLRYPGVVAFEPKDPVTPGHILVVPERHVPDATDDPALTGRVMEIAARLAHDLAPANIITSIGEAATQSVYHLHIHVVPRREDDGLALPWSTGSAVHGSELEVVRLRAVLQRISNGRYTGATWIAQQALQPTHTEGTPDDAQG